MKSMGKECWNEIAKLGTKLVNVLKHNKTIAFGVIFPDRDHLHLCWTKVICSLSIFFKLTFHFLESGPRSMVNSKSNKNYFPRTAVSKRTFYNEENVLYLCPAM